LIRGFGRYPELAKMDEVYGLKALGIAGYPMYRGVAGAVGMDVLQVGWDIESECAALEEHYGDYDYFYVHVKKTDSAGEDGNFDLKVKLLEELDAYIPRMLALEPDVLVVTGDHSTPSTMGSHSWHPVPTTIAGKWALADRASGFSERHCAEGSLGVLPSSSLMALSLAHARRLDKFGA
jgi:2,3-bisphosphoglycerate-independent phosphoglycerate mutase